MNRNRCIRRVGIAWLELALVLSLVTLALHLVAPWLWSAWIAPVLADREKYTLRNSDFPDTHISQIHLDLTAPLQYVILTWTGPHADSQETGPFRSSPGAGLGYNDCNDSMESNCFGSLCTPKGERLVEGFADHFDKYPSYTYLTIIDKKRAISFHYHPEVPDYPASQGCIRLDLHAARLIHNNSLAGVTKVLVDGTWTPREDTQGGKPK